MHPLGLELTAHAPRVLERWTRLVAVAPYQRPADLGAGDLPRVVRGLIEASILHPETPAAHERHVQAAVDHGERRRREGADERAIWREFEALREAVREHLATLPLSPALGREARVRLDMAISVAEMAAVRGYHRDMLERTGAWAHLVPTMARQSPLVDLPPLPEG